MKLYTRELLYILLLLLVGCGRQAPVECAPCHDGTGDIILIEFPQHQEFEVSCRGYDVETDETIHWNETIVAEIRDIELVGWYRSGRTVIMPDLDAYVIPSMKNLYASYERPYCFTRGYFEYNFTISGKTTTGYYNIDYEDCDTYYTCGITDHWEEIFK